MIYHGRDELITTSKNANGKELFSVLDSNKELLGFCNANATGNLCTLFEQGYMLQYGVYLFKKV